MGQAGLSGKACRAARCGASGKRQNAAGGPARPTGGRVLLPRGLRCVPYPMPRIALRTAPCHGTGEPGQSDSGLLECALVDQAKGTEARMAVAADDDMIMNGDAQMPGGFNDFCGHRDVSV